MDSKVVLITGTSPGLGKELLRAYVDLGWRVVNVNRRSTPELSAAFPEARFEILDIENEAEVSKLLQRLEQFGCVPSLFILNAGINKPDAHESNFNLEAFKENIGINLFGVMTFIAAAKQLGLINRTFVAISSVSNFIPYPGSELFSSLRASGKIPSNLALYDEFLSENVCNNTQVLSWSELISNRQLRWISLLGMSAFYACQFLFRPQRLIQLCLRLLRREPLTILDGFLFGLIRSKSSIANPDLCLKSKGSLV